MCNFLIQTVKLFPFLFIPMWQSTQTVSVCKDQWVNVTVTLAK